MSDTSNKNRIVAAMQGEVKAGKIKRILNEYGDVLLCNVDNEYYAVENLCPHEDFPLHLGCLQGDEIECSLHGARYSVKTGEPTHEPGERQLKTYPVEIVDKDVYIEMLFNPD